VSRKLWGPSQFAIRAALVTINVGYPANSHLSNIMEEQL